MQPPIMLNPLDGTTCDGVFTGTRTLLGITTEGASVDVYVDGVLTTTLTAGGSGYFRFDMVLPDGEHTHLRGGAFEWARERGRGASHHRQQRAQF